MYSSVSGSSGTNSSRVKLVVCSALGHVCARVQDVSKPSLCDVSFCSRGSFVSRQLLAVNDIGVRVCVYAHRYGFSWVGAWGVGLLGHKMSLHSFHVIPVFHNEHTRFHSYQCWEFKFRWDLTHTCVVRFFPVLAFWWVCVDVPLCS